MDSPGAAEFFAGIGLVGMALESAGIEVRWANDIEPIKAAIYHSNDWPGRSAIYQLGDVRDVDGAGLPEVELATASFPCVDLSLAGWRRGLAGEQSGMFWEFARVLGEMRLRPRAVLLENVPAFATSHGGRDLRDAVAALNELGYSCDLMQLDARRWVPQSRVRLFIVGLLDPVADKLCEVDELRPEYLLNFATNNSDLDIRALPLVLPTPNEVDLADVVERLSSDSHHWWDERRTASFINSLSPLHRDRLGEIVDSRSVTWRTAYRRTRRGVATWEIRPDNIAGCLRTARGGSSKQAVVEAGRGVARLRWMTDREYARLQGVPDTFNFGGLSPNKVMFGFGDAVCVPVVEWIAREYLLPALQPVSV